MKTPDENLQDRILNGDSTGDYPESEVNAYKMIFRALPREKGIELPADFAEKLSGRLIASGKEKPSRDMWWLAASIAGLVAVMAVTFFITRFRPDLSFLGGFSSYWGIMATGAILIIFIQFSDLKLIRLKLR